MSETNEVKLWGLFHACAHRLYTAERADKTTVIFKMADSTYFIQLSEKADAHIALVGFDGFLLRHGLADGTRVLDYTFAKKNTTVPTRGWECIDFWTAYAGARRQSEYEDDVKQEPGDYYRLRAKDPSQDRAYTHPARSQRIFLSVPITREGSRSLVCQLTPWSLQRQYVMLVATREEVQFVTCNSY